MGSASGGTTVPSTLRVHAVMTSRDGMFLKLLALFTGLSMTAVSCASLSTFYAESGSPGPAATIASPWTEPLVEFGGEVESAPGEVEYVMGALTATESAREVAIETEVLEHVSRREAARLGRLEDWVG